MNTNTKIFLRSYIQTALWSSTGEDDKSLDSTYDASDIHRETLNVMVNECERFIEQNLDDIRTYGVSWGHCLEIAAHDFWLTRNGHGAGFWDGNWPEDSGKRLTDASKVFGIADLYIGDDGKIHQA